MSLVGRETESTKEETGTPSGGPGLRGCPGARGDSFYCHLSGRCLFFQCQEPHHDAPGEELLRKGGSLDWELGLSGAGTHQDVGLCGRFLERTSRKDQCPSAKSIKVS